MVGLFVNKRSYLKYISFPTNNSKAKVTPFCTVPVKEGYGVKSCAAVLLFSLESTYTCTDETCLRHLLPLATFEAFAGGAFVTVSHCSWHERLVGVSQPDVLPIKWLL